MLIRSKTNDYNIDRRKWSEMSDTPVNGPLSFESNKLVDADGTCLTDAYFPGGYRFEMCVESKDGKILVIQYERRIGICAIIDSVTGDLVCGVYGRMLLDDVCYGWFHDCGILFYSPFDTKNVSRFEAERHVDVGNRYLIIDESGEPIIPGKYLPTHAEYAQIEGYLPLVCEEKGFFNWLGEDLRLLYDNNMVLRQNNPGEEYIYSERQRGIGVDMILKDGKAYDIHGTSYDFEFASVNSSKGDKILLTFSQGGKFDVYECSSYKKIISGADSFSRVIDHRGDVMILFCINGKQRLCNIRRESQDHKPDVNDPAFKEDHDKIMVIDNGGYYVVITVDDGKITLYDSCLSAPEIYDNLYIKEYYGNDVIVRAAFVVGEKDGELYLIGSTVDGEHNHILDDAFVVSDHISIVEIDAGTFVYASNKGVRTDTQAVNYIKDKDGKSIMLSGGRDVFVSDDVVAAIDKKIEKDAGNFKIWNM